MSKILFSSLIFATVLIPSISSAQPTLVRSVESAARGFRIQLYDAQRLNREQYNQRRRTGDIMLAQWRAANEPADMRQEIVRWFDEAALASKPASPLPLPGLPVLTEARPAAVDANPVVADPFAAEPRDVDPPLDEPVVDDATSSNPFVTGPVQVEPQADDPIVAQGAAADPVVAQEVAQPVDVNDLPKGDFPVNYFPTQNFVEDEARWDDAPIENPFLVEPGGSSHDVLRPAIATDPTAAPHLPELPRVEVDRPEPATGPELPEPPDFLAPPMPVDVEQEPATPAKADKLNVLDWINREMRRAVKIGPPAEPSSDNSSHESDPTDAP